MTSPIALGAMVLGIAAIATSTAWRPRPLLIYNASDSAPRGWYAVVPALRYRPGDYVLARLPEDIRALAAKRGYLPRSVPLLKRIAAVAGQRICIRNAAVHVDDVRVATTLDHDGMHRPLSAWSQCRVLLDGELFLLNPTRADSFDSRYFGPLDASFVRGRAFPMFASSAS